MIISFKDDSGTPKLIRLKAISQAKPITIGRGDEADIVVSDAVCSRIHSAIRYWDDIFIVRDMGSKNGTYLNGNKIEVAALNPGDIIKIGNTELTASAEAKSSKDVTIVSEIKRD